MNATETTHTVDTWKAAQLTGIVIRRTPDFMGCVIVPATSEDTGETCWNRFDKQSMAWEYRISPLDIIAEVDGAYSEDGSEVEILLHDLTTTETGQFDPFSV
tara:strand:- start:624 stop:929 length:306 start_codon:yes stop_codon:yes gene_type:complete